AEGIAHGNSPVGRFVFPAVLGWLTERIGGRVTGLIGLGLTLIPLLTGWRFAVGFSGFLAVGVLLGIAGASFAVALPLASAWYPPEYLRSGNGNRRGREHRNSARDAVRAETGQCVRLA